MFLPRPHHPLASFHPCSKPLLQKCSLSPLWLPAVTPSPLFVPGARIMALDPLRLCKASTCKDPSFLGPRACASGSETQAGQQDLGRGCGSRPRSSEEEGRLLPAGGRTWLTEGASSAQDPTPLTRLEAGALASKRTRQEGSQQERNKRREKISFSKLGEAVK